MTTQGNIATTNVLAPRPTDLASATESATAAYLDGSQKPLPTSGLPTLHLPPRGKSVPTITLA